MGFSIMEKLFAMELSRVFQIVHFVFTLLDVVQNTQPFAAVQVYIALFVQSQKMNVYLLYKVAPDLVPDADVLEHSLISRYFVERLPLYHLTCAIEEKCLSSSAEGAHDYDERCLLTLMLDVCLL